MDKFGYMRRSLAILFAFILLSCSKDPIYPYEEPLMVEIIDVEYIQNQQIDSLLITLKIDHQFNFGLSHLDKLPPFHEFDTIIGSKGNTISPSSIAEFPLFTIHSLGRKQQIILDSVPSFCREYYRLSNDIEDTVLVQNNEFYHNLNMNIYNADSEDLLSKMFGNNYRCELWDNPLNMRIPFVDQRSAIENGFTIEKNNKYQMIVTVTLSSNGWRFTLKDIRFLIKAKIMDRELNISAPFETELMTLDDITVK